MTGEERRIQLLKTLQESPNPISGAALAAQFQVSRQVIVQDIARLRAANEQVLSTARGYQVVETSKTLTPPQKKKNPQRVYHVSHTNEQMEEEMNIIVDMGGRLLDVFVKHGLYGSIRGELLISCRRQVWEFMEGIRNGTSSPLKDLTFGEHYHTVEADQEEILDLIGEELDRRGFLKK
jgi:hypothetical protein